MSDTEKVQSPSITKASEAWECRTRELEARRLLAFLDHACVDESVCDTKVYEIAKLLFENTWKMCSTDSKSIIEGLIDNRSTWAGSGFMIIIEGGIHERDRRKVLDFLLYQAILARFKSYSYIARIYDWPAINGDLCRYECEERPLIIEGMTRIGVLGINEFDLLSAPSKRTDLAPILTGIIRKRKIGRRPTIITMSKPSWEALKQTGRTGFGEYIESLFQTPHDEQDKIIRIRLSGGPAGWEKEG